MKINRSSLATGLVFIIVGIMVMIRGRVWGIILGHERYFVGGIALAFGIIASILSIKKGR